MFLKRNKISQHLALGKWGEKIACRHLKLMGLEIICKNYFVYKIGEIDIIALDLNELVFVEVKTRSDKQAFVEAIDDKKRLNIVKTASYYRYKTQTNHLACRFDVIEILVEKKKKRVSTLDYFVRAFF